MKCVNRKKERRYIACLTQVGRNRNRNRNEYSICQRALTLFKLDFQKYSPQEGSRHQENNLRQSSRIKPSSEQFKTNEKSPNKNIIKNYCSSIKVFSARRFQTPGKQSMTILQEKKNRKNKTHGISPTSFSHTFSHHHQKLGEARSWIEINSLYRGAGVLVQLLMDGLTTSCTTNRAST